MEPRRHHYVPQFYLRRWADPSSGKLRHCSTDTERVFHGEVSPKGTCFEQDLYKVQELPENRQQFLEKDVLQPIDNAAAISHELLLADGVDALSTTDRNGWTRFVTSLHPRSLEAVLKRLIHAEIYGPMMVKQLEQEVTTDHEPDDRTETISEYLDLAHPHWFRDTAQVALRDQVGHPDDVKAILAMSWWLVRAPDGCEFITSDNPLVVRTANVSEERCQMHLPLSPKICFFATAAEDREALIKTTDPGDICDQVNTFVIKQAFRRAFYRRKETGAWVELWWHKRLNAKPATGGPASTSHRT